MSFTTEDIQSVVPGKPVQAPVIPGPVFMGYDPKGTTTITGSEIIRPATDVKQEDNSEGRDGKEPSQGQPSPLQEESVTLSPKLTAIARREQAQRQREIQFKQKEKELADRLAKADKFEAIQKKLEAKDYSAADELGLKYEEYTDHLVKRQEAKNPEAERVSKVEQELAQFKKEREEQTVRDYQANQSLWKQEISRVVNSSEDFSSIKELKAEDLVLQHINDSFEEDNIELSAEQAAKEIEEAILERAQKVASLTKLQKRAGAPRQLGAPKTITQNMTVSSQKPVKKPFHLMSESEQIAEAIRRVQEAKLQR